MKDRILASALLIIMSLNFIDVLTDINLNVPMWHIVEEMVIVAVAGILALYLIWDMNQRTQKAKRLYQDLQLTRQQLNEMSARFSAAKSEYLKAVDEQFSDWQLTESEREISLFILKGLSLQEIATIRDTKEKTVRQQASAIYSKAGVEGRHGLAAWFFEDWLTE